MDEIVKLALAKWPDVPDCTGWLALDARGRWRIGEAKDGPRQPITNAAMNGFINRNYFANGRHWIFQNGPQRVFVELEYTPFVWRLSPREDGQWSLVAQTGVAAEPRGLWLDDAGRFLVEADPPSSAASGSPWIGVVHDHDTALVAELLRDDAGNALEDDVLTRLVETDTATVGTPRLRWPRADRDEAAVLPLQRIPAHQVPIRFDFEPNPSVALKLDVDTRR